MHRHQTLLEKKNWIEHHEGGLDSFSKGYEQFGFNLQKGGISYCEWAPNARDAYLIGDFSKLSFFLCYTFLPLVDPHHRIYHLDNWNRSSHPMTRDEWGKFHLFLPDQNGVLAIPHGSRVKVISLLYIETLLAHQDPSMVRFQWSQKMGKSSSAFPRGSATVYKMKRQTSTRACFGPHPIPINHAMLLRRSPLSL